MKRNLRIAISAACALLAAGACLFYGKEVRAEADRERAEALARFGGETVRLLVADDGLEPGDVVGQGDLSAREWAASLAPEGALTSMEDALGRTVTVPLAKGSPLTELNFRETGELPEVPSGYMAFQVQMSEKLGLPSAVPAGTRLVAYQVGDEGTKVLSSDVQVLLASEPQNAYGRGSISVAARPEDVSGLLAAGAEGSLRLVMPSEDVEASRVPAAPTSVEPVQEEADGDE